MVMMMMMMMYQLNCCQLLGSFIQYNLQVEQQLFIKIKKQTKFGNDIYLFLAKDFMHFLKFGGALGSIIRRQRFCPNVDFKSIQICKFQSFFKCNNWSGKKVTLFDQLGTSKPFVVVTLDLIIISSVDHVNLIIK